MAIVIEKLKEEMVSQARAEIVRIAARDKEARRETWKMAAQFTAAGAALLTAGAAGATFAFHLMGKL